MEYVAELVYYFFTYMSGNQDTGRPTAPDSNAAKPITYAVEMREMSGDNAIVHFSKTASPNHDQQNEESSGQKGSTNGPDDDSSGQHGSTLHNNGQTLKSRKNKNVKEKKHNTAAMISINEGYFIELLDEKEKLKTENTRLRKENNVLWNQSAEVFKQNRDKRLELVNDPYPLGTIVADMRHLFTTDWCEIWEEGEDDCSTIQQISDMLETVNEKCTQRANQQIRSLLCLDDENDPVPTRLEKPDIYRLRRKEGIDPGVRERVTRKIVSELLEDPSLPNAEWTKEEYEVRNFFRKFAEFCWLLAIAEERVLVFFKVIGKDYEKIKHYFDKYYMTNHKVTGTKPNLVKTLVWPCVTTEDGTLLEKGHVIVVENFETQC